MTKKELEKLYEDGKFYRVYKIALKVLQTMEETMEETRRIREELAQNEEMFEETWNIQQENKKLREAFTDIIDGQSQWYEIRNDTGLDEKRCKEIEKLFNKEIKRLKEE